MRRERMKTQDWNEISGNNSYLIGLNSSLIFSVCPTWYSHHLATALNEKKSVLHVFSLFCCCCCLYIYCDLMCLKRYFIDYVRILFFLSTNSFFYSSHVNGPAMRCWWWWYTNVGVHARYIIRIVILLRYVLILSYVHRQ